MGDNKREQFCRNSKPKRCRRINPQTSITGNALAARVVELQNSRRTSILIGDALRWAPRPAAGMGPRECAAPGRIPPARRRSWNAPGRTGLWTPELRADLGPQHHLNPHNKHGQLHSFILGSLEYHRTAPTTAPLIG